MEVLSNYTHGGLAFPASALNVYDMIWATAVAFARAAWRSTAGPQNTGGATSGGSPSGEAFMAELPNVAFRGVSGPVSFANNGDRLSRGQTLVITNLVWSNETRTYESREVGRITFDGKLHPVVELNRNAPDAVIVWPDGTVYPQVTRMCLVPLYYNCLSFL